MTVGDRLRARREERGFSQEDLAARARVHRNTISDIERGEASATMRTLTKLADGLDCGIQDLIADAGVGDQAAV